MTHLGTQIAALVDGQLPPAAAERALCHVAGCADCAAEVVAQRAARAALASAGQVPVAGDLTARLLALGANQATFGCPPERADTPVDRMRNGLDALRVRVASHAGTPVPMPSPRAERVAARACLGAPRRSGIPAWAVLAVAGVAVTWLFAMGEESAVVPHRHPAQALGLLAAAEALAGDGVVDLDEATMAAVPDGYEVVAVQHRPEGVEVDLDGPYGAVVVTQQAGRLDPAAVAGAPVMQAGGHDVHVLSQAPWHMVWQSGDTVVSVVSGGPSPAVEAVATAYPSAPFDDGVDAQISRGWAVVAGHWTP